MALGKKNYNGCVILDSLGPFTNILVCRDSRESLIIGNQVHRSVEQIYKTMHLDDKH